MAVPNIFATATSSIPLSQLDTNFSTAITLGSTALYLGNTTTSVAGLTVTGGAFNGTVGATTPSTGAFTTGTFSSTLAVTGITTLGSTLVVTAPASSLGVVINANATSAQGALYFYAANGTTQYATVTSSASEFRLSAVPAATVQTFYTNGSERLRIDSTGNVGIGTATPAYKLDVSGTLGVTGAVTLSTALPVASGGTGLTSIAHTVQVFTSGSGTYTTPANVKAIWVRAVGGGGGAGGSGSAGSPANGTGGGSTTFSTLTASAGAGGPNSLTGGFTGGAAGGASGGDINQTGNPGTSAPGNTIPAVYQAYGCNGGASVLGGGGIAASNGAGGTGGAGTANSGGGGGGVGGNSVTYASAGGGGAGYVEKLIAAPAATYAYAVGAGGAGGASGTGGGTGGAGGSGVIIVTEYYV